MSILYKDLKELSGKTFVVFDLETTGLFFEYFDEPIEIGAVKIDDKLNIVDTFHAYIMPRKKISSKITEITGLNEDVIIRNGYMERNAALKGLLTFIGNSIPVGHNVGFDINFVNYWTNYSKLGPLITDYICTCETYKRLYKPAKTPKGEKWHANLTAMCEFFGITNEQAHSGIEDAIATAKCFIEMLKRGDSVTYFAKTKEETYCEFKSRVMKSRVYGRVLNEITTVSPITIRHNATDSQKTTVLDLLNKYESPKDIATLSGIPIGVVYGCFVEWINKAKLKKMSGYVWNDRRTPLEVKEILGYSDWDVEKAYKLMKYLTPYPPNKLVFEVIAKLYAPSISIEEQDDSLNYSVNDLDEYFINFHPIRDIEKKTMISEYDIVFLLADWLKSHQDNLKMWIGELTPKYLPRKDEYQRMKNSIHSLNEVDASRYELARKLIWSGEFN